jgi:preprotein translocase subunit SecB
MNVSTSSDEKSATRTELVLLGEYVKDLSFECPFAPHFRQWSDHAPKIFSDIDVKAAVQSEDVYEVMLNIELRAKNGIDIIYHLELSYGGLFRLRNIPMEKRSLVLKSDCSKLLFPSLRRVIADVTYYGGFPPLLLDFGKLRGLGRDKV